MLDLFPWLRSLHGAKDTESWWHFSGADNRLVAKANPITGASVDKKETLHRLLERIDAVMMARKKKYILFNLPKDRLDEAASIIGGMKSPTVTPLMDPGWISVQSAVDEERFWSVFESLRAIGAEGILVMNIEKMTE